MTSMPLKMTRAQLKSLNPSIGRIRPLTARWSCAVVLLNDVVQILDLTNLDRGFSLGIHRMKRGQIGSAFINGYRLGRTVLSDRLFKEASGSGLVALGCKQEVNGLARLVYCPIEVLPLSL